MNGKIVPFIIFFLTSNCVFSQSTFIPHFTGAYIHDHYLICPDVNAAAVYQESLKDMFPYGNLHFMDSWLYAVNLKMNMLNRTAKF
ncbi:MAG: hypothetical protein PHG67_09280 [Bacteroidales bacterium]|jgi:hypothetical protein|nr:hypothetical protein [Bacteroidales bacterium]